MQSKTTKNKTKRKYNMQITKYKMHEIGEKNLHQ